MAERMMETDVLVVGGGGAGFRAAIGAREAGAKALMLSKGPFARCGATPMAGADFTLDGRSLSKLGFPGAPDDTEEKFFNDIVTQGYYLNNQKLVEQYIRKAPERLKELLDWGIKVLFSEERAIFTSGLGLMDALLKQARAAGVDLLEDTMLLDLVAHDGKIAGGLGLDIRTGEFIRHPGQGGGHGHRRLAQGFLAEYGDARPLGRRDRHGPPGRGRNRQHGIYHFLLQRPPVPARLARKHRHLYHRPPLRRGIDQQRQVRNFLEKYDPYVVDKGTTMEWNKGFISYATIERSAREGKALRMAGVYYGLGKVPWESFENDSATRSFPTGNIRPWILRRMAETLKNGGTVEVGPAVEYFDGGIVVNEKFETNVPGLYAAGECTLGPFGVKPGLLGDHRDACPRGRCRTECRSLRPGGERAASRAALFPPKLHRWRKRRRSPGKEGRIVTAR